MKLLGKRFLTGLAAVLPLALTIYLLYWLAASAESVLGHLIRLVLPSGFYWPGMGLIAGVILVLSAGVLMEAWFVRTLFGWAEALLYRTPVIRTVYGSFRDLMGFVSSSRESEFRQVVAVRVPLGDMDLRLLGFVTRNDLSELSRSLGADDQIAVYLPMSYQIGGHTVMVSRGSVEPVDMSMQEAMRFVLTAGIATGGSGRTSPGRHRT